MKRIFCICLSVFFLLTGCQSSDEEVYQNLIEQTTAGQQEQTEQPEPNGALFGTLRVSTYYDEEIKKRAQEFEQLHPGCRLRSQLRSRTVRSGRAGKSICSEPRWR